MLWFLMIGIIAGWLAGKITGGGFGLIGDLVVGIIGSFIGGYLFGYFGLSNAYGTVGEIGVATVGAIFLLWIVRLIR